MEFLFQVHNLPLDTMTPENAETIGSIFGSIIELDQNPNNHSSLECTSVSKLKSKLIRLIGLVFLESLVKFLDGSSLKLKDSLISVIIVEKALAL